MTEATTPSQPEAPKERTLTSLFNGKSMLMKIGFDMLFNIAAYAIPTYAVLGQGPDPVSASTIAMLSGMFGVAGGALTTAGRYTGGIVGLAVDAGINKFKGRQALTPGHFKRGLASVAGTVAGGSLYLMVLASTGIAMKLNVVEAPVESPAHIAVQPAAPPPVKALG